MQNFSVTSSDSYTIFHSRTKLAMLAEGLPRPLLSKENFLSLFTFFCLRLIIIGFEKILIDFGVFNQLASLSDRNSHRQDTPSFLYIITSIAS